MILADKYYNILDDGTLEKVLLDQAVKNYPECRTAKPDFSTQEFKTKWQLDFHYA